MKKIKISLAVIVAFAIAFFVIQSLVTTDEVSSVSVPKNQFIERIEQEVDSLSRLPNNKFGHEFYKEVGYHIDDYYDNGRFGNTPSENDQWKETLTKNLYTAYANKFVQQAFYVFKGAEWDTGNLKFIRAECHTLRRSQLLERGSPIDQNFAEIQTILDKYEDLSGFIFRSSSFSYAGTGLSDHFPISTVTDMASKAISYLDNNLGNQYIGNCVHLRDGLKGVPQALFRAHVRYLDHKISEWSGMYSNFNSQRAYTDNLYQPLKSEISTLRNSVYGSNIDSEYNRLMRKLDKDSQDAYNYFNR